MPIDPTQANQASNTIAVAMADIQAQVNKAGGGVAQGVDAAKILAAVNANKDALVASGGGANFVKIQDLTTQLNADFTGAAGQDNQTGTKFNQDMSDLTTALNAGGVQFDTVAQAGHFDGNTTTSSATDAAAGINTAISDWDAVNDDPTKLGDQATAARSMLSNAQSYVNGANLTDAQKAQIQPLLDAANSQQAQFASDPSTGNNAFLDAWEPLKAALASAGLTGMNA